MGKFRGGERNEEVREAGRERRDESGEKVRESRRERIIIIIIMISEGRKKGR